MTLRAKHKPRKVPLTDEGTSVDLNGQSYDMDVTLKHSTALDTLSAIRDLPVSTTATNGVQIQQSIMNQQNAEDMSSLVEAILAAVVIVYIVMLITFGEWFAPFAILFSMPVALIEAFFGSLVAKQPISVSSMIGILMLMGIVVTNAIVLVGRVEQQRGRGLSIRESLLEAGTTRLRPILMTAIATILTLCIVPLMYELLHFRVIRRERKRLAEMD